MKVSDDASWLRTRPDSPEVIGEVTAVDVFAGCGGMTLGFDAVARSRGLRVGGLAIESDPVIAATFTANFPQMHSIAARVETLIDGECGKPLTDSELRVQANFGSVDVVMGGPPCQGHSDLNNHTRRSDPRNALYLRVVRAAEIFRPAWLIIENVPSVVHDRSGVVETAVQLLKASGYQVESEVVSMVHLGVPQTRRRHVLLASRTGADPKTVFRNLSGPGSERTVRWAIEDLVDREDGFMDRSARRSAENARRMRHLFDREIYDLPNELRPACHRDSDHSYKAVYGRLRWDRPAPTITTGFTSMGQGRYVHPGRERTLTPHEAARLQTFPDWYIWKTERRTLLSTMIGNAVPPLVMARLGSHILTDIADQVR